MNFFEAVEDWKSNDEWRYADKEAAWKFFFAAGKESPQAVISAQCVKMSQYESIIFELRTQLAAEQLNNKMLREALEFLNARIVTMDLGGVVERALSLPHSTSALDAYVAEKVKEYGDEARRQMQHATKAVWQRDLAVEALEKAREEMACANFNSAAERIDHALHAIKESEKP